MTKDEALKQALVALEDISTALREDDVLGSDIELILNAAAAIRVALAQPAQEINQPEIFCGVDYADGVLAVSVMRRRPDDVAELLHIEQIELAEPDERNFCPRCGKRTADLTTIHTCTPPQEKDV